MTVSVFQRMLSVLLVVVVAAAAQEPLKPKLTPRIITATKQVAAFTDLEKQMLAAVQKKDKAALEALLTDDCVIEMPDADMLAGDEWVDSVMAQGFVLKSYVVRQLSVAELENAAVVKYDRVQEATSNGKAENGEFFVVDVWKKSGESWKLANRYVSQVSSTPGMPAQKQKPTGKE